MDGPSIFQGREKELGPGLISLPAAGPWTSCGTDALVRPITCPSKTSCLSLLEKAGYGREKLQPLSQLGMFSFPSPHQEHSREAEGTR